jgi:threonine/homoserine/homoserine lactone efflux protein
MEIVLFFKGIVIGFAIAAPLGPVNLLIVQRTLTKGRRIGWLSGAGAAIADGLYAALAVYGLTLMSGFLSSNGRAVSLVGGIVLVALGIKIALTKPSELKKEAGRGGHAGAFTSTFFLNLLSPVTILTYAAAVAGLSGIWKTTGSALNPVLLILGVPVGSMVWVTVLVLSAHLIGKYLNDKWLHRANLVAGFGLALFGLLALASGLRG